MQSLTLQQTADGSFTLFSHQVDEPFHPLQGARQTAELIFVQPAILPGMVHRSPLRLLDIGYGLGYNTAAALEWIWSINPGCKVEVVGLEVAAEVPQAAIVHNLNHIWHPPIQPYLTALAMDYQVETEFFVGQILLGDARQTIQQLQPASFDAIFLHPFSPSRCPELWTVDFLVWVARCLKPTGRLATHASIAPIRSALIAANLQIGSTQTIGRQLAGTIAAPTNIALPPLSAQEQTELATCAAVPYRDPNLADSALTILQRRQQEHDRSL
jgi:tRNA U34 5-methylaminomethyl-2-thiouridine-forming methyltransferase MnmC